MNKTTPDIERFYNNTDKNGPNYEGFGCCWEWKKSISKGYRKFSVGSVAQNNAQCMEARKFIWQEKGNTIPDKWILWVICNNEKCVNPAHLQCTPRKKITDEQRFWKLVNKNGSPAICNFSDNCWDIDLAKNEFGHARIQIDGRSSPLRAHSYSWELANKQQVPVGFFIKNLCGNKECINPKHLELIKFEDEERTERKRKEWREDYYDTNKVEIMAKKKKHTEKCYELGTCPTHAGEPLLIGLKICKICRENNTRNSLKATYNLEMGDFNNLLKSQSNKCFLCENILVLQGQGHPKELVVQVDHDNKHEELTGEIIIRGLLCPTCNSGLGLLKEDVSLIEKSYDFYSKYKLNNLGHIPSLKKSIVSSITPCSKHPGEWRLKYLVNCIECAAIENWNRFEHDWGISRKQYFEYLEERKFECDHCHLVCEPSCTGKGFINKKNVICVDHDHHTNIIRGFLCSNCNFFFGKFDILGLDKLQKFSLKAGNYLKNNNVKSTNS